MFNPYEELAPNTRRMLSVGSLLLVLVLWSTVTGLALVSKARLPSLLDCLEAFQLLAWDESKQESPLLIATFSSLSRIAVAGFFVVLIGTPLGVLMGSAPRVNAFFSPLIDPFRSAPVVALLPIFVMWLGIGEAAKISFLFVGAVVFLIPMVRDSILAVSQQYWIAARDLGATNFEAVRHAVLPMAMPRIADSIIVAFSVMWTYITVAEYVNAQTGLGQLIQNARRFSAMDQVFVGIFVIIVLALLTFTVMNFIKRQLFPWESE